MTLVDSGRVAFSNPVRQSLYTFEDCLDGGRPKAEAAAEAIRAIFPGCRVEGRRLAIAMPGHPLAAGEAEEVRKGTEALEVCASRPPKLQRFLASHIPLFKLVAASRPTFQQAGPLDCSPATLVRHLAITCAPS